MSARVMASPKTPLLKADSIRFPVGLVYSELFEVLAGFSFSTLQVKHFL